MSQIAQFQKSSGNQIYMAKWTLIYGRWKKHRFETEIDAQACNVAKLKGHRGSVYEMDGQTKCHRNGNKRCPWNG